MKVGELIAALSKCEMDAEVGVSLSDRDGHVSHTCRVVQFKCNGKVAYAVDMDEHCFIEHFTTPDGKADYFEEFDLMPVS